MKCPKCGGTGWDIVHGFDCVSCDGKGEIEVTNEEWLRSATFEELAGAIYEWHTKGYTKGRLEAELNPITDIVEWLKQPHSEVGK